MCSLFPEDHEIEKEDLIRYAIGLRQGGTSSLEYERSCVKTDLKELIDCCLLIQDEESKEYVKMHDLVRDAALWIANRSKDHKMLVNFDKPLGKVSRDVNIRDFYAVSSWYKEEQICLQWDAPELQILLLNTEMGKGDSMDLSQEKLEEKEGLKVLSVINSGYFVMPSLSLPQSIKLRNLRTLRLQRWSLGDISFIGCLESLAALHLEICSFSKLPDEIGKLQRLKLLELSNCCIEEQYNGAIGKCVQLEELYFTGYGSKDLFIQIIVDIVTLPNLNRFVICSDFASHWNLTEGATRRLLEIQRVDNMLKIGESNKNLLQKVETLILVDLGGGCKNIIPDMNGVVGGMNDLTYLYLERMKDLECIFDHTASASQLPSIFPSECNLGNLKILEIENSVRCKGILGEALFSMSAAQSLTQLEEIYITHCDELKHIVARGRECGSNTSNKSPSSSHSMMPSLKKLRLGDCSKLKTLFPICCIEGLARLQKIRIDHAPKLEYVFGECDHKDLIFHQYENQVVFPCLDDLSLSFLKSLIGICPENYNVKLPTLREVSVDCCPKLTTSWIAMIVRSEKRHHHMNEGFVLSKDQQNHSPSKLQQLELRRLPQLNLIPCIGPAPRQILSLHCLQNLEVYECENLKSLFSIVAHRSLPELRYLVICDCQELEQIISENEESEHLSNVDVFFPKLMEIRVAHCHKLKSFFSVAMARMLPQLSILYISKATQLEEVFRHGNEVDSVSGMEIVLPNLTKVELYHLPNFVDICQGFKLQAVKLEYLRAFACPKIAPSFREIQVGGANLDSEASESHNSEEDEVSAEEDECLSL